MYPSHFLSLTVCVAALLCGCKHANQQNTDQSETKAAYVLRGGGMFGDLRALLGPGRSIGSIGVGYQKIFVNCPKLSDHKTAMRAIEVRWKMIAPDDPDDPGGAEAAKAQVAKGGAISKLIEAYPCEPEFATDGTIRLFSAREIEDLRKLLKERIPYLLCEEPDWKCYEKSRKLISATLGSGWNNDILASKMDAFAKAFREEAYSIITRETPDPGFQVTDTIERFVSGVDIGYTRMVIACNSPEKLKEYVQNHHVWGRSMSREISAKGQDPDLLIRNMSRKGAELDTSTEKYGCRILSRLKNGEIRLMDPREAESVSKTLTDRIVSEKCPTDDENCATYAGITASSAVRPHGVRRISKQLGENVDSLFEATFWEYMQNRGPRKPSIPPRRR